MIYILSGAGLSAESGISTFRGSKNSLWENHDVHKICDYLTWKDNREIVHKFYNQRRQQLKTVEPNAAHNFFAELSKKYETIHYTQNIDNLLERSGTQNVVHLHGFLNEMQCVACGNVWFFDSEWNPDTDRCKCNSLKGVKPAVVFFNEKAPEYTKFFRNMSNLGPKDIVIVVGTSSNVIPIEMIWNSNGIKIGINPDDEMKDEYDFFIHKTAVNAIDDLKEILNKGIDKLLKIKNKNVLSEYEDF